MFPYFRWKSSQHDLNPLHPRRPFSSLRRCMVPKEKGDVYVKGRENCGSPIRAWGRGNKGWVGKKSDPEMRVWAKTKINCPPSLIDPLVRGVWGESLNELSWNLINEMPPEYTSHPYVNTDQLRAIDRPPIKEHFLNLLLLALLSSSLAIFFLKPFKCTFSPSHFTQPPFSHISLGDTQTTYITSCVTGFF